MHVCRLQYRRLVMLERKHDLVQMRLNLINYIVHCNSRGEERIYVAYLVRQTRL
jgi:hypothetical protein